MKLATRDGQSVTAIFRKYFLPCMEEGKMKIKTVMILPEVHKE